MLIDGGDKDCSSQMYSYLKKNDISYPDIVVASHAHAEHVGIKVPKKFDTYALGSATITILGLNAGEGNDSSIILRVTYGDKVFLFTGDAEREAEQAVLAEIVTRDINLEAYFG